MGRIVTIPSLLQQSAWSKEHLLNARNQQLQVRWWAAGAQDLTALATRPAIIPAITAADTTPDLQVQAQHDDRARKRPACQKPMVSCIC